MQIWTAAGTYKPDDDEENGPSPHHENNLRTEAFSLHDFVELYGGFLGLTHPSGGETALEQRDWVHNETILSGDIGDEPEKDTDVFTADLTLQDMHVFENYDENSLHVVLGLAVDDTAILDGFTVSGGNADTYDSPFELKYAGGVALRSSSGLNATIRNCIIKKNKATDCGAGIASDSGTLEIRDTVLQFNQAVMSAAIFVGHSNTIRLIHSTLTDNRALGVLTPDPIGGAGAVRGDVFIAVDCEFSRNSAFQGFDGGAVLMLSASSPTIVNCLFASNWTTGNGGAIEILLGSTATNLINSTFVANHAEAGGAIYYSSSGNLALQNCILWDNTSGDDGDLEQQITGTSTFNPVTMATYTCIQGLESDFDEDGFDDQHNTANDPEFVGPPENCRLSYGSSLIDVANNTVVPVDDFDVDFDTDEIEDTPDRGLNTRIVDGNTGGGDVVDMGCFEYCPADLDGNGKVDSIDLGYLLSAWGTYSSCPPYVQADFDENCNINSLDLGTLLGAFGGCEQESQSQSMMSMGAASSQGPASDLPAVLLQLGWDDVGAFMEWFESLSESEQGDYVLVMLVVIGAP